MIDQCRILLPQTESRGWFGADDRNSFTSKFGERLDVLRRELTDRIQIPRRNHRHSRSHLTRRDVDRNPMMAKDSDEGPAELRVMPVRVVVDEIDDRLLLVPADRTRQ